jgi:hypothetical protein
LSETVVSAKVFLVAMYAAETSRPNSISTLEVSASK